MNDYAVWALGADRPGIVAAVTGALLEHGCNLKDCSMTVLSGHFAMMLLVEAGAGEGRATLEQALSAAEVRFDLTVAVRPLGEAAAPGPPEGDPYIVSVYGSDKPGIVHYVTKLLAGAGVNVTDVNTRVIGADDDPVYAMLLEVTLPEGLDPGALGEQLKGLAAEMGVDASLHPADADVL